MRPVRQKYGALDLTIEGEVQVVEEEIRLLPRRGQARLAVLETLDRIDQALRAARRSVEGFDDEEG